MLHPTAELTIFVSVSLFIYHSLRLLSEPGWAGRWWHRREGAEGGRGAGAGQHFPEWVHDSWPRQRTPNGKRWHDGKKQEEAGDRLHFLTVPPVVPCHVVVHREVIHSQKKAFLLLCRRACVFQSSHRLIWCSIFLHTLLEQTSVEIDKSALPNRGTVAQGDAQRAQEPSVCVWKKLQWCKT